MKRPTEEIAKRQKYQKEKWVAKLVRTNNNYLDCSKKSHILKIKETVFVQRKIRLAIKMSTDLF